MTLQVRDAAAPGRLGGVSLDLGPGEILAVVGRNGAGKSSLVDACLGRLRLQAGRVTLGGQDVSRLRPRERAARLGWLPQRAGSAEGMSALDVVAAARFRFREGRARSELRGREALARMGAEALADRRVERLSGGELQRVRLAALSAQEADLWLLDEPANHLDPAARIDLWARLAAEAADGRGVLVVSHDVALLDHLHGVPVRVLGLFEGRVAFCLPREDDALPERLGELLGLTLARVRIDGDPRFVATGRAP